MQLAMLLAIEKINYAKVSKRSGCLYGYSPQLTETSVRQPGDWNQSVIKQVNGVVELISYVPKASSRPRKIVANVFADMLHSRMVRTTVRKD